MALKSRTSAEIPITLEPARRDWISAALDSVFSFRRPIIAAFAPSWTRAETCAEQMSPWIEVSHVTVSRFGRSIKEGELTAPPVQRTTLPTGGEG